MKSFIYSLHFFNFLIKKKFLKWKAVSSKRSEVELLFFFKEYERFQITFM